MISRLNKIIVNLKNIENNLISLKGFTRNAKIMLPVKADAYGHGLEEVVKYFRGKKMVDAFCVATIDEASIIRNMNVEMPILILGTPTEYDLEKVVALQANPTISTIANHQFYNQLARKYGVHLPPAHLEIDTGMGRNGICVEDVEKVLKQAIYKIEGIYTHFATADDYEMSYFLHQKSTFFNLISEIKREFKENYIFHSANSSALLKDDSTHLDAVRPGLISYGYYPADYLKDFITVEPAMSLETSIVGLKKIKKGESVSYGIKWKAKRNSLIGIIPIGYGDGILRSLSNNWSVVVNDTPVPVIGIICMDQMMIDCTDIADKVKELDKVLFMGKTADMTKEISCEKMAAAAGTIPYEIVCHLKTSRVDRHFLK